MGMGPLLPLFLIALFFDAVTVAVARQGNQGSSPIIFASLIAMSAGSTAAFLLAALLPDSDRLVAVTVAATLGTLFGCVAANDLRALFACRTRVEATYRGCEDVPTAHVMTLHYPVFSYEHRGRPYHGRSIQSVSGRRAREMSASGTYPIYLDPRQPAAFITRRRVGVITVVELLCALGCFAVAAWVLVIP